MKTFPHYVAMPIADVMNNPEEYIIPENLKAIERLWNMNILTKQTNDYENEDSWIALGMLSMENHQIFYEMYNDHSFHDPSKPGILNEYGVGFRVPVKPGTRDTYDDFLPLLKTLKMQDVQRDGYMTLDEFFSEYTDCWKVIDNPYLELEPKFEDYGDDIVALRRAMREFDLKGYPKGPRIKVYDESKATKGIEEYLYEAGFLDCYDKEEGKVFLNRRLYEGHMRYKNLPVEEQTKPKSR